MRECRTAHPVLSEPAQLALTLNAVAGLPAETIAAAFLLPPTTLMPAEPEVAGLTALLELHEARAETRFAADGGLVLLEDQDRSRWDRQLIHAAVRRLARAAGRDRPGPYQLEAALAAQHALAPSFDRRPPSAPGTARR